MFSPRIADCCASTKCGKREVTVTPDVSSNKAYIERDRAFSRVFAAWLLGFEGTPCVSSFRASNISKLFRPLDPAFTRSEYEKWKKVIVEGKIKPE